MSITTEYIALWDQQLRDRELTTRLEQRRREAERRVAEHGGERLAYVAALARRARGAQPRPAAC